MSSIAVYGVMLAGWSSGSKYPLLGSVRATAQMVSYEAALGLSALAVLLQSGSLETSAIVRSQTGYEWNIWMTGLIPFIIFFIASTAEINRPPFDLVEAEQELVGGFHTEYSSIRFALFFLAEFMNAITMSAVIVTLFLGGPAGPNLGSTGWVADYVLPFIWFFAKVMLFLFTLVWMRGTLPRFRYDQLMDLGWKFLIPLALGWLVVLVALRVSGDEGWNWGVVAVLIVLGLTTLAGLLTKSIRTAEERRELEEVND
jgi:NADH-quinone oxidoreductase subunit H